LKAGRIIGKGGGGSVRKMRLASTQQAYAVKRIDVSNTETRRHVYREIEMMLKFGATPSLIRCFGVRYLEGYVEIAMEYMDGGSLGDLISRHGAIPEPCIGSIALGALRGLHHLHQHHVLHRDIKPQNLLLSRKGECKLSDLGCVEQLSGEVDSTESFVGTMLYMAPERLDGQSYSYKSDVWSFGLTLAEAALGCFPFKNIKGYWGIMRALNEGQTPLPPVHRYSADLIDLIGACLQQSAETRASAGSLMSHPFILRAAANPHELRLLHDFLQEVNPVHARTSRFSRRVSSRLSRATFLAPTRPSTRLSARSFTRQANLRASKHAAAKDVGVPGSFPAQPEPATDGGRQQLSVSFAGDDAAVSRLSQSIDASALQKGTVARGSSMSSHAGSSFVSASVVTSCRRSVGAGLSLVRNSDQSLASDTSRQISEDFAESESHRSVRFSPRRRRRQAGVPAPSSPGRRAPSSPGRPSASSSGEARKCTKRNVKWREQFSPKKAAVQAGASPSVDKAESDHVEFSDVFRRAASSDDVQSVVSACTSHYRSSLSAENSLGCRGSSVGEVAGDDGGKDDGAHALHSQQAGVLEDSEEAQAAYKRIIASANSSFFENSELSLNITANASAKAVDDASAPASASTSACASPTDFLPFVLASAPNLRPPPDLSSPTRPVTSRPSFSPSAKEAALGELRTELRLARSDLQSSNDAVRTLTHKLQLAEARVQELTQSLQEAGEQVSPVRSSGRRFSLRHSATILSPRKARFSVLPPQRATAYARASPQHGGRPLAHVAADQSPVESPTQLRVRKSRVGVLIKSLQQQQSSRPQSPVL